MGEVEGREEGHRIAFSGRQADTPEEYSCS